MSRICQLTFDVPGIQERTKQTPAFHCESNHIIGVAKQIPATESDRWHFEGWSEKSEKKLAMLIAGNHSCRIKRTVIARQWSGSMLKSAMIVKEYNLPWNEMKKN